MERAAAHVARIDGSSRAGLRRCPEEVFHHHKEEVKKPGKYHIELHNDAYRRLIRHGMHCGVVIEHPKKGVIRLVCVARTHGGHTHTILTFSEAKP